MSNENKSQMVAILDSVNRTILGELGETTEHTISIKNPVILDIMKDDQNRMSVQLFPIFFREFMADREQDAVVTYNRSAIATIDVGQLDFRLQAQWSQLFGKGNAFVPPAAPESGVTTGQPEPKKLVNLFDAE